ncbi:hypothetical protein [Streptomyces viridochromogenes]|uniref:hypothetical protein n=1 Tax=Streptomyces viridochromogenes TaxID=1938 RepID=UPI00117F3135|nr:hypothetical protein [Streptomyces viridochromogenes]
MDAPLLTLYRGQKEWAPGMAITAPSLRCDFGAGNPRIRTKVILEFFYGLIAATEAGDSGARAALENELLQMQTKKYTNPFVSCSQAWWVAEGFAKKGDTSGFVLTIDGAYEAGVAISELREKYDLAGDAVDHLKEFGIPERLGPPFFVKRVQEVYPYGKPAKDVFP